MRRRVTTTNPSLKPSSASLTRPPTQDEGGDPTANEWYRLLYHALQAEQRQERLVVLQPLISRAEGVHDHGGIVCPEPLGFYDGGDPIDPWYGL